MAKELYVGHLSEQTTEEDLRRLFSVMGVVTSVHLITDADTGEFKRCGYVRMLSDVDLKEVVETLDGAYLIDRVITVSIAKPQNERTGKGGNKPAPSRKRPAGSGRTAGAEKRTDAAVKGPRAGRPAARPSAKPSGPAPGGRGRR